MVLLEIVDSVCGCDADIIICDKWFCVNEASSGTEKFFVALCEKNMTYMKVVKKENPLF
jgi:hypothetical protein